MTKSLKKKIAELERENEFLTTSLGNFRIALNRSDNDIEELKAQKKALLEENVELLERLRRILKDEVKE